MQNKRAELSTTRASLASAQAALAGANSAVKELRATTKEQAKTTEMATALAEECRRKWEEACEANDKTHQEKLELEEETKKYKGLLTKRIQTVYFESQKRTFG